MSERIELTEAEMEALGFQTPGSGGLLAERIGAIIAARLESVEQERDEAKGMLAQCFRALPHTWLEQYQRAEKAETALTDLLAKVEALAATWEGDSLGGDRYCAGELRALLEESP